MSRRHALFEVSDGDVRPDIVLRDLGSTNGVAVEGVPLTGPERLQDRSQVTLGDIDLVFRLLPPLEIQRRQEIMADARDAVRDPLTGCRSRRFLVRGLPPLMKTHLQAGLDLTLAIFDIDHFKLVNDNHGHGVGDKVLQRVAEELTDSFRTLDYVVRYGGEEFVAILPGTALGPAAIAMERVRSRVEALDLGDLVPDLRVTVSGGFDARVGSESTEAWFERVDDALYRAKRAGRNRVFPAGGVDPAG